jgi:hypothetical protein
VGCEEEREFRRARPYSSGIPQCARRSGLVRHDTDVSARLQAGLAKWHRITDKQASNNDRRFFFFVAGRGRIYRPLTMINA